MAGTSRDEPGHDDEDASGNPAKASLLNTRPLKTEADRTGLPAHD